MLAQAWGRLPLGIKKNVQEIRRITKRFENITSHIILGKEVHCFLHVLWISTGDVLFHVAAEQFATE